MTTSIISSFRIKGIIELPIVVKFGKNEYDLVAGNTRIAGLVKYNINPTIWVVEL